MAKPFKKALTISTCLLVAVALTIGAVAWFSGVLNPGILGFQTGSNAELPGIQMWMYTSKEDLIAQNNPEGNTGWEEVAVKTEGEDAYIIPAAPSTTSNATDNGVAYTKHEFQMQQLHFGVVDNLISLKEDNIIYLRLAVDAAKTGGDSMTFKISYVTETEGVLTTDDLYNSIDLYDGDGKLADADTLSSKIKFDDCNPNATTKVIPVDLTATTLELAESARFLQIAAAVTTESDAIPGTEKFKSLVFTDFALIGDTGSLNFAERLGTAPTGTYYVYLKIAPNLDFFVYQEDLLDQFIPAHIFFDGKIELEMH